MPKGMTVREFVEYAAWIKNSATVRASAAEAIEAAQLSAFADRRLGHVSGGVAQRTGFASVLVDAPDVLLLDEPTTGVDIHQREVMREIIAAQSPGRTTILSSHIAEDLEQLCDRILVLVKGRPRFLGSVDEARAETGEETLSGALLSLTAGVE
jgi:ABC-type multidrug transport system ATPase subunit